MKRYIALLTALIAAAASVTACSKNVSEGSEPPEIKTSLSAEEEASRQPDPLAPTDTEDSSGGEEDTTSAEEENTSEENEPSSAEQEDPLGGGEFSYNSDGAVVFSGDITKASDRMLMNAAQALFTSACRTEWRFFVDGAYSYDKNSSITNSYGWEFYRVTADGVTSFNDVRNDYGKVFSSKYPNELADYYKEENGAVYELNGARGGDLYYSVSKIISLDSRDGNELFFTVEHYYDGSDLDGSEPYSKQEVFSVVIDSDGVLKAGKFRLPY